MLPDDVHQIVNLALAGVRSPRASGREAETAEPWGDEVLNFPNLVVVLWVAYSEA